MTMYCSSGDGGESGEGVSEDDTVTAEEGADVRNGVGGFGGDVEGLLPPAVVLGSVAVKRFTVNGSIGGLEKEGCQCGTMR